MELLVVVLIIGILAAVALPQYNKVIERTRMAEAVTVVRAIAQSQQMYYILNGEYASCMDFYSLDIEIPGKNYNYCGCPAKQSDSFVYASGPCNSGSHIAIAQRNPEGHKYYITTDESNPSRVRCYSYSTASDIQKQLCDKLDQTGLL